LTRKASQTTKDMGISKYPITAKNVSMNLGKVMIEKQDENRKYEPWLDMHWTAEGSRLLLPQEQKVSVTEDS
jgi:hypothetical protein